MFHSRHGIHYQQHERLSHQVKTGAGPVGADLNFRSNLGKTNVSEFVFGIKGKRPKSSKNAHSKITYVAKLQKVRIVQGKLGKMASKHSKITELRKNPLIDLWWDQLNKSSETTADTWIRALGRFCEVIKITPQKLASLSEQESYELRCRAVTRFEELRDNKGEPLAPSYIRGIINKKVPRWIIHSGGSLSGG